MDRRAFVIMVSGSILAAPSGAPTGGAMRRDGRPGRAWRKRDGVEMSEHWPPRLTNLDACREAWGSARNPEALLQGILLCADSRPLPGWLADALICRLKLPVVTKRLWAPYRNDCTDLLRFVFVRQARKCGLTWEESFTAAAKELEQSSAFA